MRQREELLEEESLALACQKVKNVVKVASVVGEAQLGTVSAGGDSTGFPGQRRECPLLCRGQPWPETLLLVLSLFICCPRGEQAIEHSR